MMETKPAKVVHLNNGLILKLFDGSRRIAGDRWLVSLVARIEIVVEPQMFDDDAGIDFNDIRSLLGDNIVFEQKMDRNFVDENEKDDLIASIIHRFSTDMVPYLSHQQFAYKYIIKRYQEAQKRRQWYS